MKTYLKALTLLLTAGGIAFPFADNASAASYKKSDLTKVKGGYCVLVKSSWVPVKKDGKKYKVDNKASKALKNACKALLASPNLQSAGLSKLPSPATLLSAKSSSASSSDVSGTAPLLVDIPGQVKNTFWRSGVIEAINAGTPTSEQCNEFFAGSADGQSGGMIGCYMTQNVGYSFQSILQSGTSLCYMKNAPTDANLQAGGISIQSGSLPDGQVSKIFSVPSGAASRIIEVQVSGKSDDHGNNGNDNNEDGPARGQTIFIKIDSQSDNTKNGNQYAFTLWQCHGGANPSGFERTEVTSSGQFHSTSIEASDRGNFSSEITAFLKQSGDSLVYDLSKDRRAVANSQDSEHGFSFKSDIVVTSDNLILSKVYDIFGEHVRKAYGVSEFSGSSISSLRFLQGSYKEDSQQFGENHSFNGAIEYRDSNYAAAPSNALLSDLNDVDTSSDGFYSSAPSVSVDTSDLSCSAQADLVITMDMSNSALAASVSSCEGERLDGMDFCRSDSEVNSAEQRFFELCRGPEQHE